MTAREQAIAERPLPDHWKVGHRIRYIKDKEFCCNAGELGTVIDVRADYTETPANKYQVFWTRPDKWGDRPARFWTTPDEVELATHQPKQEPKT